MARDAILRNLAVIGEAARSLPAEVKLRSPDTPWPSIAGLRNVVVHELLPLADAIRQIGVQQSSE
jgi:uncharacterized protein with HEPN domain